MFKKIIKAYRRNQLRRAIKNLGPTAEILCYNVRDNKFFIKYTVGASAIKCLVYYDPTKRQIVFDGMFYEHPDF